MYANVLADPTKIKKFALTDENIRSSVIYLSITNQITYLQTYHTITIRNLTVAAMAPAKSSKSPILKDVSAQFNTIRKKYVNVNFAKSLVFDPARLGIVSIGICFAELVLNVLVIRNVRYTEIDWVAYMQECEGFLNGTTDYSLLKGMFCHNFIRT